MRKMSAYGRKLQRRSQGDHPGVAPWMRAINASRSYADGASEIGNAHLEGLRLALERLVRGATPPENTSDHDDLLRALATARIRAAHIGGPDNPADALLGAALAALNHSVAHWEAHGEWRVGESEAVDLKDALDAYETLLMASSPLQMQKAYLLHLHQLRRYADGVAGTA